MSSMNETEFTKRLEAATATFATLLREFEKFDLYAKKNNPGVVERIRQFQNQLFSAKKIYEDLVVCRNAPELGDSYFRHMRTQDLTQLEKQSRKLTDDFTELSQWVHEETNMIASRETRELGLFSSSTKSHYGEDAEYGDLFMIFIRQNLKFDCPFCQAEIGYGDERCGSCDKKQDWWWDQDDILERFASLPKSHTFYCPNEGCGAMIKLDWDECAYCGMDIQKMLEQNLYFD